MERKGLNRALNEEFKKFKISSLSNVPYFSSSDPCIFISHKKEDKEEASNLAKYIEESGIDVFFDANDENLNNPEVLKNPVLVTNAINNALSKSTHMIAVISNKTKESWWVPYEIGFATKNNSGSNSIRALFIKGFTQQTPEYLEIVEKIKSTSELDAFLKNVSSTPRLLNESYVKTFSQHAGYHPMKSILL
jgi:MTH538 TIR-like domain (DUF1863).